MFQYQIWKKSLDVQYIVEAFVVLLLAIFLLTYAHSMTDTGKDVKAQQEIVDQDPSSENYSKLGSLSDDYLRYMNASLGISVLMFSYLIKDIQELVYANIRGVYVRTFTGQLLMNIACTITVLFWLIKHFGDFTKDLDQVRQEEKASTLIRRMEDDEAFNVDLILALLIGIQFTRLVFALEVNRTFGPMVKILGSMIVDIISFLILYICIFFIFVGISTLLFYELDEYEDVKEASKTLFGSSLGNFEYTVYDPLNNISPDVGYIFITVFLIFTMIMLLNFLIAILSNTYSVLNDVKNGLYLRKVLYLRQRYNYDRYYSAIIYATPPLNLVAFILMPVIIYCKSRKLNRILLICQYILIGLFSIVLFFVASVIMMPFAYFLVLFDK